MNNEMHEIVLDDAKNEKPVNPYEYVTITVKEYRKMIRKIERIKADKKALEEIAKVKEKAEDYRRWWREEEHENKKLKEALEDAKSQLKELLGVEDASDEQTEG